MKKILLTTALCLALGLSARAQTESLTLSQPCTGGKVITGTNGKEYCQSTVIMNWYTAFAWCQAHGMNLVTMEELCNTDTFTFNGDTRVCSNIAGKSSGDVWTAYPTSDTNAYGVNWSNGGVNTGSRNDTDYAFCR